MGDFGLARWQPDGHCGVETRVIGTFGYVIINKVSLLSVSKSCSALYPTVNSTVF